MNLSFSKKAAVKQRKQRLTELEEEASRNRRLIDNKLNEATVIDQQLKDLINDTKKMTKIVKQKINSRLKITTKTLKSICHSMTEGVVILNSSGKVIEINDAFEKMFNIKDDVYGVDFKTICQTLHPTKENGDSYILTPNFQELSKIVFLTKNFTTPIQKEVSLRINSIENDPIRCIFSLTALDNEPEESDDITFMMLFKCYSRSTNNRRSSDKSKTS